MGSKPMELEVMKIVATTIIAFVVCCFMLALVFTAPKIAAVLCWAVMIGVGVWVYQSKNPNRRNTSCGRLAFAGDSSSSRRTTGDESARSST